jgi:hypothetical protein
VPVIDSLLALGDSLLDDVPEQAIGVYQDTNKAYPKVDSAYHSLASVYAVAGDMDQAITF